jgi:hypothetical protein
MRLETGKTEIDIVILTNAPLRLFIARWREAYFPS